MILAAGRGERLRPLTDRIPKPLLPIAGEALIVHQLRWLHRAGITEVVINLHHLGAQIEERVGNGRDLASTSATAGRNAAGHRRRRTGRTTAARLGSVLLLNGDIWTNYPFNRLVDLAPAAGHLVLTPKPPHRETADFALVDGRVRRNGNDSDNLVFTGIAVVNPMLFDAAPEGPFNIAHALYFAAAAAGRLTGEEFHGTWFDIGSPAQLKAVRRMTD